jgi:hypothetical protein
VCEGRPNYFCLSAEVDGKHQKTRRKLTPLFATRNNDTPIYTFKCWGDLLWFRPGIATAKMGPTSSPPKLARGLTRAVRCTPAQLYKGRPNHSFGGSGGGRCGGTVSTAWRTQIEKHESPSGGSGGAARSRLLKHGLSRRPFRCSPLAFARSMQPARVCSNTAFLEGHVDAARSRLLKHNLSGRPFRCSPLVFTQKQLFWKAIALQPGGTEIGIPGPSPGPPGRPATPFFDETWWGTTRGPGAPSGAHKIASKMAHCYCGRKEITPYSTARPASPAAPSHSRN